MLCEDPTVIPSHDGSLEANLRGYVDEQVVKSLREVPASSTCGSSPGAWGASMARRGASSPMSASTPSVATRPTSSQRNSMLPPSPASVPFDEPTKKVRKPGALDGEHLGVQVRQEGLVSPAVYAIVGQVAVGSSS